MSIEKETLLQSLAKKLNISSDAKKEDNAQLEQLDPALLEQLDNIAGAHQSNHGSVHYSVPN